MDNFVFHLPTKIFFGDQSHKHLGEEIKKYSKSKVMLCYGGSSAKKAGTYDIICQELKDNHIDFIELSGVKSNPRLSLVRKGIQLARENKVDFMLALGGGSVIDTAKAIAIGVPYDGDVWDIYEKRASIVNPLKVGTILTLAAAGSEMSNSSVITNEEEQKKYGTASELIRPVFSILNPSFTKTVDPYNTAAGIADIYAHLHERYFTTSKYVCTVDRMIEGLMKAVIQNAYVLINDPENYQARAEIMWAGCMAHNDVLTVGRNTDWAAHRIEHELSAFYDISHGAGMAVMMPAWMKYTYPYAVDRFLSLVSNVFGVSVNIDDKETSILTGIHRLEAFLKDMGLPTRLRDMGIDDSKFSLISKSTSRYGKLEIGCIKKLTENDILQILQLAY